MRYKTTVAPDAERSTDWRVEAEDDDGGIEVTICHGRDAQRRAQQIAIIIYGWQENP